MVKGIDDSLSLKYSYTPSEITKIYQSEQDRLLERLNEIGAQPKETATLESSFLALELATTEFINNVYPLIFLKDVSTDEEVRKASGAASEKMGQFFVEIFAREDLYRSLKSASEKAKDLQPAEKKLVDETLAGFIRNGLALAPAQRQIFIEKKQAIISRQESFQRRVAEGTKNFVLVDATELEGMSDEFIKGLEKTADGEFKLKMDKATVMPFIENARSEAARKRVDAKYNTLGGPENLKDLEEAVRLRHEAATMLGYRNHGHYVLDRQMAKSPEQVISFLKPLVEKLKVIGKKDLAQLKALKKEEFPHSDSEINSWDWRYLANQWKKKKYSIDNQKIKEYFPLDIVLSGMFQVYQKLFDLKFEEVSGMLTWHPSVKLFRILRQGEPVAFFYMDLFPRDGKYNHFAAFEILKAYRKSDGNYRIPVAAIVGNFSPPTDTSPSLLEHDEVETMFHEFGHIMHQTLTTAKYASLSGTSVMTDFVEAPSQMLENWVWKKSVLEVLSGHYKNPSEKLPSELIEKMLKAKLVSSGLTYLRQASFAMIDMTYHTSPSIDGKSTEIYSQLMKDTMLIPIQSGTFPQAGFGHLMGGYDAGYYGYLWSKVYAEDMFTRFDQAGLLDTKTGSEYVTWILEPGGVPNPFESIKGFLGRDPNQQAFLKSLGLK